MNCVACGHPLSTVYVTTKSYDRIEACIACGHLYTMKELNDMRGSREP